MSVAEIVVADQVSYSRSVFSMDHLRGSSKYEVMKQKWGREEEASAVVSVFDRIIRNAVGRRARGDTLG